MNDPAPAGRYNPNFPDGLRKTDADTLIECLGLAVAGRTYEAAQKMSDNATAIAHIGGALQKGLGPPSYPVDQLSPPLQVNAANRSASLITGHILTTQAAGDGIFAGAVVAGLVWSYVGDAPGSMAYTEGAGSGQAPTLSVKAGQWCSLRMDDGTTEREQNATMQLLHYGPT